MSLEKMTANYLEKYHKINESDMKSILNLQFIYITWIFGEGISAYNTMYKKHKWLS